ncbi:MAG TPA: TRAP transporter small permease [Rubrivivax sp.]|nr:TRAP transporter small permease [Rubrivivax sp.]
MSASPEPDRTPPADPAAAEARPRVPLAIEDWLTVIVMALLALITFANVLVRYFSNQSFAWTEEVSIFLMIVLALIAGSAAVARKRHIRIEFFADGGPPRRRRRLQRLASAMVALLFLLLAVLSARMVWDHIRWEETSPGIGVPQWWYSMWLPLISLAIAGRAIGLFIRQGRQRQDDDESP